jgi:hypothetical protein
MGCFNEIAGRACQAMVASCRVFAIWTGFLIYLLASQRYVAFLRPEFGMLLALAHFIAMGFMLAAMVRPKQTEMDLHAIFRSLVLLVRFVLCGHAGHHAGQPSI